jgi:hypothetical protein
MLREIAKVKQDRPGTKRRWFQDDYFDLWIWERPDDMVAAFQLCYDRQGTERILSWREQHGFDHLAVDFGTGGETGHAQTAILKADGVFPMREVWRRLLIASRPIPRDMRYFLFEKLFEFGDLRGGAKPPLKKVVRGRKKKKR